MCNKQHPVILIFNVFQILFSIQVINMLLKKTLFFTQNVEVKPSQTSLYLNVTSAEACHGEISAESVVKRSRVQPLFFFN